jgi:hypothetical protein
MKTIEVSGSCPYCGKKFDLTSDLEGENTPEPGNITICLGCAGVLIFGDNMEPKKPDPEELKEFLKIPEVNRIRKAVLLHREPGQN